MYQAALNKLMENKTIENLIKKKSIDLDLAYNLKIFKPTQIKHENLVFEADLDLSGYIDIRSNIRKNEDNTFMLEHYVISNRNAEIFVFDNECKESTVEGISNVYLELETNPTFNINCLKQIFDHTVSIDFNNMQYKNGERIIVNSEKVLEDFLLKLDKTTTEFTNLCYPEGYTREQFVDAFNKIISDSAGIYTVDQKFLTQKLGINKVDIESKLFNSKEFKKTENVEVILDHISNLVASSSNDRGLIKIQSNLNLEELKALAVYAIVNKKNISCDVLEKFDDLFNIKKSFIVNSNMTITSENKTSHLEVEKSEGLFFLKARPTPAKIFNDISPYVSAFSNNLNGTLLLSSNHKTKILELATEFKQNNPDSDYMDFKSNLTNLYTGRKEVDKELMKHNVEELVEEVFIENKKVLERTI